MLWSVLFFILPGSNFFKISKSDEILNPDPKILYLKPLFFFLLKQTFFKYISGPKNKYSKQMRY